MNKIEAAREAQRLAGAEFARVLRMLQAVRKEMLFARCQVTENLCGTDTWMVGRPCLCLPCRVYVALDSAEPPTKIVEAAGTIRA